MTIPVDQPCRHCGATTWRKGLGAADRFWLGGYVCRDCCEEHRPKVYHALVSPQGHTEVNAAFVVPHPERLDHGRWYTPAELAALAGATAVSGYFLASHPQAAEKNVRKWRYERQVL